MSVSTTSIDARQGWTAAEQNEPPPFGANNRGASDPQEHDMPTSDERDEPQNRIAALHAQLEAVLPTSANWSIFENIQYIRHFDGERSDRTAWSIVAHPHGSGSPAMLYSRAETPEAAVADVIAQYRASLGGQTAEEAAYNEAVGAMCESDR